MNKQDRNFILSLAEKLYVHRLDISPATAIFQAERFLEEIKAFESETGVYKRDKEGEIVWQ